MPSRSSFRAVVGILMVALQATACGGDDGGGDEDSKQGGSPGSCTKETLGVCYDYTGSLYASATIEDICPVISATYSADACPSTDRVGSCKMYGDLDKEQIVRFYSSKYEDSTASAACTGIGSGQGPATYTSG